MSKISCLSKNFYNLPEDFSSSSEEIASSSENMASTQQQISRGAANQVTSINETQRRFRNLIRDSKYW